MKFDLFKNKSYTTDKTEISKRISNSFYNDVVLGFQDMIKKECSELPPRLKSEASKV